MNQTFIGVIFHWLGGLASGSFYVPFRGVKRWSWETGWLVAGVFSWIIAPWFFASLKTNDVQQVLKETPMNTLGYTYLFGVLWGLGGLTFGLTMRYLGMSLGMAVALGYCTVFGTLIPPIFTGEFVPNLVQKTSGNFILLGLGVCVIGIVITALAGKQKEGEMTSAQKRETVKEFDFKKGLLIATFSGVMSACFSFGLKAAGPMSAITMKHGTPELWSGLPALIVILLGGFTTNFIWCVFLNIKNGTGYQYLAASPTANSPEADGHENRVPLLGNYLFAALAGVTWYFQFFFYSMGETKMGDMKFSSWTLHMASIIIFSSIWGLALHEWKGASSKAKGLLYAGIGTLILSTCVIGWGNKLSQDEKAAAGKVEASAAH